MTDATYGQCGPESGIRLFHDSDRSSRPAPTVKGCHHGVVHWHHVHWRLNGQAMCRIECRCGKVMAADGRVGGGASEASWWKEGVFA